MILPGYDEDACHFLKNPGSREAPIKTRCGQADPAQDVRLPLKSDDFPQWAVHEAQLPTSEVGSEPLQRAK